MIRFSPGEVCDKGIREMIYPEDISNTPIKSLLDKMVLITMSPIGPGVLTSRKTQVHHVTVIETIPKMGDSIIVNGNPS